MLTASNRKSWSKSSSQHFLRTWLFLLAKWKSSPTFYETFFLKNIWQLSPFLENSKKKIVPLRDWMSTSLMKISGIYWWLKFQPLKREFEMVMLLLSRGIRFIYLQLWWRLMSVCFVCRWFGRTAAWSSSCSHLWWRAEWSSATTTGQMRDPTCITSTR